MQISFASKYPHDSVQKGDETKLKAAEKIATLQKIPVLFPN